ncbi:VirB4 family type IV secretion system protein [Desulfosporosinus lacus]|uniref:AAA-like domain-containing protein n=1 Tax=Desulfosporosinus lacus DSM 15449 TaxID=1121420 RepID=A0A1M5QAY1_9FIRM|nr:ATP-binding protein [Desulfosporosinus lacus]SHH10653.1 AAA-like domain-containing protein [Desulfosporosinus lacus DSM 15449]
MAKRTESIPVNNALLNVITPMGLNFTRNTLTIGENKGKAYGMIKYHQDPDYGWLSKITNIPSTIVSITFTPTDTGAFIDTLSSTIRLNRGTAESTKDPLTRQRAVRTADNAEKILAQIDQDGESVGLMSVIVMPIARDDQTFVKVCRKVESTVAGLKCKVRVLANLQKEGLKMLSPFYGTDEKIENITQRPVPLSSFIGGFPFASSGYNDGTGYYFAKDAAGGLIILDPWIRGGDRTNSNFVITGTIGVGKSTDIKHIGLSEYMRGTKIIFIDPHREYRDFTLNLNGDWINAGGGSKGKVNPLQIRTAAKDDESEADNLYADDGHGMGDMALYIKSLEIFFSLYIPSLSDRQKAILKSEIIEIYNKFNIFWDTEIKKLKNTDFPIMKDLHGQITEKAKERNNPYQKDYDDLGLLLRDIAIGSDSFLWNGHTTIQSDSQCVCLDTKDLQATSNNIKSAQYFNLLQWAWDEMVKDPTQRVMLICDEAYYMIDPNVPQSLMFLRNVSKGVRKYEGALGVISHSVVDFLDPKIKMYGQPLLEMACFKILMGTDGSNLKETKELYNLTDAEEELLASKQRGQALLMVGSKRLRANFEIPDYKFEYMGKAGGR